MHLLAKARTFYIAAALLVLVGLFVPGTAGALMLAVGAILAFIGVILTLRATPPDDRAGGVDLFGG